MEIASLGYRTDLMLRRMGGSEISDRGSHLVIRTPANPLYWWGNFLLLRERPGVGEWPGWVAEFAREFPEAGHVALGVDRADGVVEDVEGVRALGLEVLVDTVMTASALQPPRVRPSAEIRPLIGTDDWSQWAQLRLSSSDEEPDPATPEFAEAKAREYRIVTEAGRGAWFGAFIDGQMRCGAGLFGDSRGVARFQNVQTHPNFRRQGLASAVVHQLGLWGLAQLADQLVMVADPDYHAIALYRSLGFEDTERQVLLQRPPKTEA